MAHGCHGFEPSWAPGTICCGSACNTAVRCTGLGHSKRVAYSWGKGSKESMSMNEEVWMKWTFIFAFGEFVSDYS